jgi:hypothetical protein
MSREDRVHAERGANVLQRWEERARADEYEVCCYLEPIDSWRRDKRRVRVNEEPSQGDVRLDERVNKF